MRVILGRVQHCSVDGSCSTNKTDPKDGAAALQKCEPKSIEFPLNRWESALALPTNFEISGECLCCVCATIVKFDMQRLAKEKGNKRKLVN